MIKMTVEVTAETPADMIQKLVTAASFYGYTPGQLELTPQSVIGNSVTVDVAPKTPDFEEHIRNEKAAEEGARLARAEKKTSKKSKAEKKAAEVAQTQSVEDNEPLPIEDTSVDTINETQASDVVTKHDVESNLRVVFEKCGAPKAVEILSKFQARRLSDVSPNDYPNLLQECKDAVK
jgi:phage/plasmid-associated DNA primase